MENQILKDTNYRFENETGKDYPQGFKYKTLENGKTVAWCRTKNHAAMLAFSMTVMQILNNKDSAFLISFLAMVLSITKEEVTKHVLLTYANKKVRKIKQRKRKSRR